MKNPAFIFKNVYSKFELLKVYNLKKCFRICLACGIKPSDFITVGPTSRKISWFILQIPACIKCGKRDLFYIIFQFLLSWEVALAKC